ncbi:MAG: 3-dehydroquinate synthase [Clostridia bacterium]|nr:3-dehydroquinate synthase [Clostridia bacterium]
MKDILLKTASSESVIHCGSGSFERYTQKYVGKQIFVITDSNVCSIYKNLLVKTFGNYKDYVIPAGEESKNPENLLKILEAMLGSGMRRNCYVIALGGGVVGDIAGLAASLYMRGTHLIQMPTTLLAQVDSSVGGKTAVDMNGVKNVIGAFYQPEEVIADPLFLKTLPDRELRCGLGEIVKYGALNKDILNKLLKTDDLFSFDFLSEIIYDCIAHKTEVVKHDEHDLNGLRKSLNLGHTTGHALELYHGEKSHGEYVLIGMLFELYIAQKLGVCAAQYAEKLKKLIFSVINEIPSFADIASAAEYALHDKKNNDDKISLIVPVSEGECTEIKLGLSQYTNYLIACSKELKGE